MWDGLEILPQFHIIDVLPKPDGDVTVHGKIEGWKHDPDGIRWFTLWISATEFLLPEVLETDESSDGMTILIRAPDFKESICPGAPFRWMEAYFQFYHVNMIRAGQWLRREFNTQEYALQDWDGNKVLGHTHCEICNAGIGDHTFSFGFVSPGNYWLCPSCHLRWAIPRSLRFLIED